MSMGNAIVTYFGGDTSNLDTAMNRSKTKAQSFGSVLSTLGFAFSAGVLIGQFRKLMQEMDEIGKTARSLGLDAEAFQELSYGAELSGVSTEKLQSSMERLNREMGRARSGMQSSVDIFDRWNISLQDSSGEALDTMQVLSQVADRMKAIEDPTMRAALAQDLFGRGGSRMVNLLGDGAAGLDQFAQAARDAGIVIENDVIARTEQLNDRLATLGGRLKRMGATVLGWAFDFADAVGYAAGAMVYGLDATNAAIDKSNQKLKDSFKNTGEGGDFEFVDEKEAERKIAKIEQLTKRLYDLETRGIMDALDLEGQREEIKVQINEIAKELREIEEGSIEALEKEIELQQQLNSLDSINRRIAQQAAAEQKRADDEKQKRQQKLNDDIERELGLKERSARVTQKAADDLDRARRDSVAGSLEDFASGDRGGARQQRTAREIQRLEERAEGRADRLGFDDERTQADLSRAAELRKSLPNLQSSDKDPFEALKESQADSLKELETINSTLEALRIELAASE